MSQLGGFAFSAGGVVVALLIAALWLWLRPQSNAARRFLIAAALAYTTASIYALPVLGTRLLASGYHRFSPADVQPGRTAIVVLGGGAETVQGWGEQPLSAPNPIAAARVLEAFRVYKLVDPSWIISSGGSSTSLSVAEPDSNVMRDMLVRLGVQESRILLESTSRDTHGQALLIAPTLLSLNVEHLILVTSEVHMRRSIGAFRAQGWSAIPAIAPDPHLVDPWRKWIVPSENGLLFSGGFVHKILGIGYYWMRAWWRP